MEEFEQAFADFCCAKHAIAVSNGTAALHCAMSVAGVGPGDEVLVTPMSFAASANCVVFQGGTPVFVDVNDDNLLIDPDKVEQNITRKTKGIIAVDYAGLPCDYDYLQRIADKYGLFLVADACHSVGGSYKGRPVGSLADMSTFSFHPVKNMTTGEGGMITTESDEYAAKLRLFRSHGITADFRQRMESGSWIYEMTGLGWNYRITDIQCALGITQLKKLPDWIQRRNEIAGRYDEVFGQECTGVSECGRSVRSASPTPNSLYTLKSTLPYPDTLTHARHLYPIRVPAMRRASIFSALREVGIGVNVHYIPIHLHPYYRNQFGTRPGDCPVAESAYEELISLPIFPSMTDDDVQMVIEQVRRVTERHYKTFST